MRTAVNTRTILLRFAAAIPRFSHRQKTANDCLTNAQSPDLQIPSRINRPGRREAAGLWRVQVVSAQRNVSGALALPSRLPACALPQLVSADAREPVAQFLAIGTPDNEWAGARMPTARHQLGVRGSCGPTSRAGYPLVRPSNPPRLIQPGNET